MTPYVHQVIKMVSLSAVVGLVAHEWASPLHSVAIGLFFLYALTARAG